ncbi:MAG: hypothetical protein WC455_23320 [Dehalococcoidia bacterium]|jgi:hypothetical protein
MSRYNEGTDMVITGGVGQVTTVKIPITAFMRGLMESGDQGLVAIGHIVKTMYDSFMAYEATKANEQPLDV